MGRRKKQGSEDKRKASKRAWWSRNKLKINKKKRGEDSDREESHKSKRRRQIEAKRALIYGEDTDSDSQASLQGILVDSEDENGSSCPVEMDKENFDRHSVELPTFYSPLRDPSLDLHVVEAAHSEGSEDQEDNDQEETQQITDITPFPPTVLPPSSPIQFARPPDGNVVDPRLEFARAIASVKARCQISDSALDKVMQVYIYESCVKFLYLQLFYRNVIGLLCFFCMFFVY